MVQAVPSDEGECVTERVESPVVAHARIKRDDDRLDDPIRLMWQIDRDPCQGERESRWSSWGDNRSRNR
jgi:hypothetical protein